MLTFLPTLDQIVFDGAGHRPHFDQPRRFAEVMNGVMSDTYASRE